jgi:hypothetical protein
MLRPYDRGGDTKIRHVTNTVNATKLPKNTASCQFSKKPTWSVIAKKVRANSVCILQSSGSDRIPDAL